MILVGRSIRPRRCQRITPLGQHRCLCDTLGTAAQYYGTLLHSPHNRPSACKEETCATPEARPDTPGTRRPPREAQMAPASLRNPEEHMRLRWQPIHACEVHLSRLFLSLEDTFYVCNALIHLIPGHIVGACMREGEELSNTALLKRGAALGRCGAAPRPVSVHRSPRPRSTEAACSIYTRVSGCRRMRATEVPSMATRSQGQQVCPHCCCCRSKNPQLRLSHLATVTRAKHAGLQPHMQQQASHRLRTSELPSR